MLTLPKNNLYKRQFLKKFYKNKFLYNEKNINKLVIKSRFIPTIFLTSLMPLIFYNFRFFKKTFHIHNFILKLPNKIFSVPDY
jgi:hypothetical protein